MMSFFPELLAKPLVAFLMFCCYLLLTIVTVYTVGVYVFNMRRMWEKLVLAARAIAAIENPADVFVVSSRPYGQRAILKYAAATGAVAIAGRFTPGTFTNYIQVCLC